MRHLSLLGLIFIILISCNRSGNSGHIQFGAYHWTSHLDAYDIRDCNEETPIHHFYIRFFDLKWNSILGPYPEAKLYEHNDVFRSLIVNRNKKDTTPQAIISPVVYLTVDVLNHSDSATLKELADNTIKQVNYTLRNMGWPQLRELQIDCDWTESTKDKYFYYLKELRKHWENPISVTVKMYQYKYREKSGVPPADKAVLMCYNLQNPKDFEVENSIFSMEEFKKYMNRKEYPLPLDFAIPSFSWVRVFSHGEFEGVKNNWYLHEFVDNPGYEQIAPNRFMVADDHTSYGHYWRKGDILIVESIDSSDWAGMIETFKPHFNQDTTTIIAYQIDEPLFRKFEAFSCVADSIQQRNN